jgi:hypothetical protein
MPIPLNTVHVAEVSMKGLIASGGSNTINTNFIFHFQRAATAVNPAKGAIATAFDAGIGAAVAAALNAGWSGTVYDVRYPEDAEDQYVSTTSAQVGAIAGDRLASDQAAFLLFRTGLRGRSFKGGKHLGPMSEADVTTPNDDVWNAAALARLATINTALAAGFTDATGNVWSLTLLSRKKSQLKKNPTTVIYNLVTQLLVNKRTGSMVRRKVKSIY